MGKVKVTGMGPFRLPGEEKRQAQAERRARRDLELAEEATKRGKK